MLAVQKHQSCYNMSSTTDALIQPVVANTINAVMCAMFSFGMIMTPQKFMTGGRANAPWFHPDAIPEERDNRLYYIAQFMGLLMVGSAVVPTLYDPDTQMLTYQFAIINGLQFLHGLVFLTTDIYATARPATCASIMQWVGMTIMGGAAFAVSAIASAHATPDVADPTSTVVSKYGANIAMCAFSSFFGLMFLAPKYILSSFWQDEGAQGGDDMCGFRILDLSHIETFWARNIGLTILGLNIGYGVDAVVAHPVYTVGSLTTVTLLTLHNLHQVAMRPYRSISDYQLYVSWIPNIILSLAMAAVLACAVIHA